MGCNLAQNEVGGKDLILKACVDFTAATANASTSVTITGHGAKVGDILIFKEIGTLTAVVLNQPYYVKEIVDANTIRISATPAGTAISMDAVEASLDVEMFKALGGIRSKSFAFNFGAIDITNQDSDEWTSILDQAGIRNCSVSGSGVYTNQQLFQSVFDDALDNKLKCLMLIEVKTAVLFYGCFKVTSVEVSGDYDAEGNFSLSAESSGEIKKYKLV